MKENKVPKYAVFISVIALGLLLFVLLYLARFEFNPSATIGMGRFEYNPMEEIGLGNENYTVYFIPHDDKNVVKHHNRGYDGSNYFLISKDLKLENENVDIYWYKRILYPLSVFLLSFGNEEKLPLWLIVVNISIIIVSSYFFLRILGKYKANKWLVLLYSFNIGFLLSLVLDLTEAMAFSLIVIALYFYEKKNLVLTLLFLSLSLFAREIALVTLPALILYNFTRKRFKEGLLFLTPLIPYSIWLFFLFFKFGTSGIGEGTSRFGFLGFIQYFMLIDYSAPLRVLVNKLSSLPVMIFILISIIILIKNYRGIKNLSRYEFLWIFDILFFATVSGLSWSNSIVSSGRFAIGLFIYSILSHAVWHKKYNIWLILLSILMIFMALMAYIIIPVDIGYTVT